MPGSRQQVDSKEGRQGAQGLEDDQHEAATHLGELHSHGISLAHGGEHECLPRHYPCCNIVCLLQVE
eukprot:962410-Amphidinium_carterae.4